MPATLKLHPMALMALLGLSLISVAGCAASATISAASPYAPGVPVNGAGEPVDPQTGITLPGVFQGGI